jgi:hypothetical protein
MEENRGKVKPRTFWWILAGMLFISILAFGIPAYLRHQSVLAKDACIETLRRIDGAKQQWALANNVAGTNAAPSWSEIEPYLGCGTKLDRIFCPSDPTKRYSNSYILGDLKIEPKCKIDPTHKLP